MRSPSSSAGPLTLTLSEVTLADIPAITEVWYNSLYAPEFASIWPDTPTCRRWWDDTNRYDLEYKPFQKYVKVTTPAVVDGQATGEEKIVAYAKWDLAMPDVRGPRFAPWGSQTNVDDADAFFGTLERERKRVCGHAPNYCTLYETPTIFLLPSPELLFKLEFVRFSFCFFLSHLPSCRFGHAGDAF